MKTIYLANFQSSHFSFHAVGETDRDARDAMRRGIETHALATGAILSDFFDPDDVRVIPFNPGDCLRDLDVVLTTEHICYVDDSLCSLCGGRP